MPGTVLGTEVVLKNGTISVLLAGGRSQLKRLQTMIPTIWHSEKGKTADTVKRSVAARGG